jgi:nucleoside phosphorylase
MPTLFKMEDYTVAWIAPLAIEAAAALQLLDEHHGAQARKPGQTLLYYLGRMGDHNIAIASFPAGECGIGVAGAMAAEMKRDLPNLEIGLLVGVGAGIPSLKNDIHLGDVAVAIPDGDNSGVIGYDLVKIDPDEIRLKQWQNASHPILRSAISRLNTRFIASNGSDHYILSHLERFKGTNFVRPKTPSQPSTCSEHIQQPREYPIVHHGSILSGNKVIKSARFRDELSREYRAIAIEMEAAGIMNALPVAVIRGISDFGDSEKNDTWQPYAAATAAAYAKELLKVLGPLQTVNSKCTRLLMENMYLQNLVPPRGRPETIELSHSRVLEVLEDRSRQLNIKNNWRNSVVDLLQLLHLNSSLEARARLARRWNVFVGKDGDPVRNIALYGLIMSALAKNQGDVPSSLVRALSVDV